MNPWIGAVALAVGVAGCGGGNLCKKTKRLVEDCGEEYSDEDLADCEAELEACTAADEKALSKFLDCSVDAGRGDLRGHDRDQHGGCVRGPRLLCRARGGHGGLPELVHHLGHDRHGGTIGLHHPLIDAG